ncbi:MAG: hypothetical protein ACRCZD_00465 [Phycicoccus sp.]
MSRPVAIVVGGVLLLMGALWTLQGVGLLEGSPMTGVTLWAVVGPIVALVGVSLAVRAGRRE